MTGIRHWREAEFLGQEAIARHRETARDHWLWIGYCHFWLFGAGAKGQVRSALHDAQERLVAERERIRHGWNPTTVMSAYAWARSQDPSTGKLHLGPCPPTVDRDWPETFKFKDTGEGDRMIADALAKVTGATPPAAARPARSEPGPTAEVIYDGDESGAILERSVANGYQPERADPDAHYYCDDPNGEEPNPFPDDEATLT